MLLQILLSILYNKFWFALPHRCYNELMEKDNRNQLNIDERIQDLLREFNGDTEAAIQAIRSHVDIKPEFRSNPNPYLENPVLLTVKNLTKTYKLGKQKLEVLRGIDLEIHRGEFVAVMGASGSGKSTLLQLMGGLDKPTSGEIMFGGKNLAKLSDGKLSEFRRQTIGFVFQFFYLQPFLKLESNLEVPGMFARAKRFERRQKVEALANKVGLNDRLNHFPKELSGGQMQRAAIARALTNSPEILLADEPTGNLDAKNGAAIIDLFEDIQKELGTTIVIVTHDRAIAARADRVISIADGRLI